MVGATSWQIRGTYLDNVLLIGDDLDFCELLVYTWDQSTEDLLIKEMDTITQRTKISVHLPTDTLDNVKQAVGFFEGVECLNLTLHPFAEFKGMADFYFDYQEKKNANPLSLENLEDDLFREFAEYLGDKRQELSITMDYGHLLFTGENIGEFYHAYASQIREIHFHGASHEKAHIYPDKDTLDGFLRFMKTHELIGKIPVCIELFQWPETKQLVKELKGFEQKHDG